MWTCHASHGAQRRRVGALDVPAGPGRATKAVRRISFPPCRRVCAAAHTTPNAAHTRAENNTIAPSPQAGLLDKGAAVRCSELFLTFLFENLNFQVRG